MLPFKITAIGEDEAGNPYVTNYIDGTILALKERLQFSTATPTGTAVATVTPTEQLADSTDTLAKEGTMLFVEGGCRLSRGFVGPGGRRFDWANSRRLRRSIEVAADRRRYGQHSRQH